MLAQKAYILFYEKKWIFDNDQQLMPPPLTRKRTLQNIEEQEKEEQTSKKAKGAPSVGNTTGQSKKRARPGIKVNVGSVVKREVDDDGDDQMEEDLANFEAKSKQKKSASRSGLVTIIAKRKPKLSTEKLIKKVIGSRQQGAKPSAKKTRNASVSTPKTK